MKQSFPLRMIVIVGALFACGTLGYWFIEKDWTLFESFYMTAITITTVGYGETRPLSDTGRAFTVLLIFSGLGFAAVFASQLARTFLENNFKELFGANKMEKQIRQLKDHFIVCGFGDIGSSICSVLHQAGVPFVVIESDDRTIQFARQRKFLTIKGKATYDTTLHQAGIQDAAGMVICLGDDSINMHVSLAARELNPGVYIITRGYGADIEKRMVRAGANIVVNPLKLGGQQIAELIVKHHKKTNIVEDVMVAKSSLMGYSLKMYQHFQTRPVSIEQVQASLGAAQVLKIRKLDGSEVHNPDPDALVQANETLLFLIEDNAVAEARSSNRECALELFQWSTDYSVGVKEIDEEHQVLFELCNEFIVASNQGKGDDELSTTLDRLIDYTVKHFKSEEELFAKYGYPDAQGHAAEHTDLAESALNLSRNKTYLFADNVAQFLSTWLKDHILGKDMEYARFLQEKGVVSVPADGR